MWVKRWLMALLFTMVCAQGATALAGWSDAARGPINTNDPGSLHSGQSR
jgi:hypothetical protein